MTILTIIARIYLGIGLLIAVIPASITFTKAGIWYGLKLMGTIMIAWPILAWGFIKGYKLYKEVTNG